MSVQDWVLAVCQWAFLVALLPTIFGRNKPELTTSVSTGTLCAVVTVTYGTLALWASAISAGLVALAWFVIAAQALMIRKRRATTNVRWRSRVH